MATTARLLAPDQVRAEQEVNADITVVSAGAYKQAPVMARGVAARSGRLWGLLSAPELVAATHSRLVAEVAASKVELSKPILATVEAEVATEHVAKVVQPVEQQVQAAISPAAAAPASAPVPTPELEELKVRLEQALRRVDVLESRLETQEQRQANHEQATERKACSSSSSASPVLDDDDGGFGRSAQSAGSTFGGLAAAMTAAASSSPSPAMFAPLHLYQPFSFEEFRRAQSPRLQAERMRMIMPPHHFPVWPLPKK